MLNFEQFWNVHLKCTPWRAGHPPFQISNYATAYSLAFNYSGQRRWGKGNWEEMPPPSWLVDHVISWESSCIGIWCRSPATNDFGAFYVQFLCDFMHLSVHLFHLAAAWNWVIPTSLYWLVGLMFAFNFLGPGIGHPTWIFGVPWHPRHPHGCATDLSYQWSFGPVTIKPQAIFSPNTKATTSPSIQNAN